MSFCAVRNSPICVISRIRSRAMLGSQRVGGMGLNTHYFSIADPERTCMKATRVNADVYIYIYRNSSLPPVKFVGWYLGWVSEILRLNKAHMGVPHCPRAVRV